MTRFSKLRIHAAQRDLSAIDRQAVRIARHKTMRPRLRLKYESLNRVERHRSKAC